MSGSRHQRLFKENVRKPKRDIRILKIRVRKLFTHREGISTPRARHKGHQLLIECAQRDFKIIYFPNNGELLLLYYFIIFYYYFFIFLSWQGCYPCSYVSLRAMRKLDLRSFLSLNVCVLNWFYVFRKIYFILRTIQKRVILRCWTL